MTMIITAETGPDADGDELASRRRRWLRRAHPVVAHGACISIGARGEVPWPTAIETIDVRAGPRTAPAA